MEIYIFNQLVYHLLTFFVKYIYSHTPKEVSLLIKLTEKIIYTNISSYKQEEERHQIISLPNNYKEQTNLKLKD